ncbi:MULTISPECIES: DNA-binding protein [Candidatus Accumulibacter]|jgi:gp16 family phage-associated protein|uniref:DNA-binding protein n=1 Tax=Candidatus Accumulibacter TaxID=327159 RepID=UPI001A63FE71|nr:DNA-binding protein [Accumulibacter sp.]MBL8374139.1 DNA-binding protein [Accumulibacter sp.]
MRQEKLRTREEVIEEFSRTGQSMRGWAIANGLSTSVVAGVLKGRFSGRIGKSHKAAVLLGIKEGEIVEEFSHE